MSEEKLSQQQEELKNFRRSRKDEEGRDYVCGCGKSYLSYPALYTHIKTKHEGTRPEGTCKVGTVSTSKRNSENGATPVPISDAEEPICRIPAHILKQIEDMVKIKEIKFLHEFDERALGSTNPDLRITRESSGAELYLKYEYLLSLCESELLNDETDDNLTQFLSLSVKSSVEEVLVVWLLGVGRFVSRGMMGYYEEFAQHFSECWKNLSEEIVEVMFKRTILETKYERENPNKMYEYSYIPSSSRSKQNPFANVPITINVSECKYLPLISEFFIREYIPYEIAEDYYVPIMRGLCEDFCKWMFNRGFSIVEVTQIRKPDGIRKDLVEVRERKIGTEELMGETEETSVDVGWEVSIEKIRSPEQFKQVIKKKEKSAKPKFTSEFKEHKKKRFSNHQAFNQPDIIDPLDQGHDHSNSNELENEESLKIDPEIVQRDRSGSINQFIGPHGLGLDLGEEEEEGEARREENEGYPASESIHEEEIEKYLE